MMWSVRSFRKGLTLALILSIGTSCSNAPKQLEMPTESYQDLVAYFEAWREYRVPPRIDGVPDFSAETIAEQWAEFPAWRAALDAFEIDDWAVSEQVDWHLVNAELNGLRFDHEVLKPWERDPAYYVYFYPYDTDVPNREAPMIEGSLEVSYYNYPLSDEDAAHIEAGLRIMPALYEAARENLTGNARDLWVLGIRSIRGQSGALEQYAERLAAERPGIAKAALEARAASDSFADWLEEQADSKTGPSGVGKENMTWALQNVHYQPYTWEEEVTLVKRELARSHAALRLEENRNRHLPDLERISSAEEYDRKLNAAVNEYMAFLEEEEILPMKDYMEQALRERIGSFQPLENPDDLRGFFSEVGYRD